mgnify:CR=1 FL=1
MKLQQYYVYIVSNKYNKVLYIGVTNNLNRRVHQHRDGVVGFTKQYNAHKLLYYDVLDTADAAIMREKQLKNWHREWKLNLIQTVNPEFRDLSENL